MAIYLDHAATTPLDPRVKEAMIPYLEDRYQNPSSPYSGGRKVREGVEQARAQVAAAIGAEPARIVFTSGGTESDNLAIKGIAWSMADKGRHIITTAIEHRAVLDSMAWLEMQGFTVTYLPVDRYSRVDPEYLRNSIRNDTVLISVMWANNETGTLQPVKELAGIAREHKIVFHTDAVQAVGTEEINVTRWDIDLISLSSHKVYGPKGAGALYCRDGVSLTPLLHGGQQESHVRGGTEPVANIVGFGVAMELLCYERVSRVKHLQELRAAVLSAFLEVPDMRINGHPEEVVPGIINLGVAGIDGEALLILLDQAGVQASQSSACTSASLEPSHVLQASGIPEEYLRGTIRLSPGKDTTLDEVTQAAKIMKEAINRVNNCQRGAINGNTWYYRPNDGQR